MNDEPFKFPTEEIPRDIEVSLALHQGVVIMRFDRPVEWMGLSLLQAEQMARMLRQQVDLGQADEERKRALSHPEGPPCEPPSVSSQRTADSCGHAEPGD